jgi:hypothetical protein
MQEVPESVVGFEFEGCDTVHIGSCMLCGKTKRGDYIHHTVARNIEVFNATSCSGFLLFTTLYQTDVPNIRRLCMVSLHKRSPLSKLLQYIQKHYCLIKTHHETIIYNFSIHK